MSGIKVHYLPCPKLKLNGKDYHYFTRVAGNDGFFGMEWLKKSSPKHGDIMVVTNPYGNKSHLFVGRVTKVYLGNMEECLTKSHFTFLKTSNEGVKWLFEHNKFKPQDPFIVLKYIPYFTNIPIILDDGKVKNGQWVYTLFNKSISWVTPDIFKWLLGLLKKPNVLIKTMAKIESLSKKGSKGKAN